MVPLLVVAALLSPGAQKKQGTVCLVHTEADVPAAWRDALQKAAQEVDIKGNWLPPPAVTLEEAQLALGCSAWNTQCAGQIAGMTGATQAIVVGVSAKGITVDTIKPNGSAVGKAHSADLPDTSDDGLEWAKDVVRGALKGGVPALLLLTTNVAADVHIDGAKIGTTRPGEALRARLVPGERRVSLMGPGQPESLVLTVKAGEVVRQERTLAEGAVVDPVTEDLPPPLDDGDKRIVTPVEQPPAVASSDNATIGWSLAGAGGVVAVVATALNVAAVWDLYGNRVDCPAEQGCAPEAVMFGLYSGGERLDFYERDGSVWIGSTAAAIGVGAILAGTGVLVAMSTPDAEGE